jgi:S1-C subfamily serine protease
MIEKLVGAAMMAALLGAPAPEPEAMPSPFFVNLALVDQPHCGRALGSGSWIDSQTFLTAEHVTSNGPCTLGGRPAEIIYKNAQLDIAVLKPAVAIAERMPISCNRPRRGDDYFAVGYALGKMFVVQRYVADGGRKGDLARFRGSGYQGMSGGPVVDREGQQVAVLTRILKNGLPVMFARPLADTYLCESDDA